MAKIIVKTQLDSSEFTKQAQALQQTISKLESKKITISVDTSSIDTKAVSAMARLTSATARQTSADTKAAAAAAKVTTAQARQVEAEAKLTAAKAKTISATARKTEADNKATAAAAKVNAQTKEVTKSTGLLGDSLANIAVKMAVWQVMGTLVATPLRAINDALDTMKKVDSQLTVIKKVTGAPTEQLKQIENQAYKTASAYGAAADAYLQATAEFARAGYQDQSEALAELAVKTQLVGDVDEETADQFLLSVDAAYKYNGAISELTKVLDGANEIDNNYATSIQKIAEGLGKVAPIASQANVGIDELSAAIGTITAVTQRSGTEAATALRALFLNIIGDTKTEIEDGATWTAGEIEGLRDVLRQYSSDAVEAAEATGSVIDPMEAIGGLAQSMKDGLLTESQLMSMVSDIGGKLRTSQLLAIVENWDMYESMLNSFNNSVGSADKEVENALGSWDSKLNILKNTFTEFIQETINTDWIKKLIDGLTDLISTFDNLGNVIPTVLGAIAIATWTKNAEKVAGAIEGIKYQLTLLKMTMADAGGGISGLKAGFSALVSSINPVTAVLTALTVAWTAYTVISGKVKKHQEELRRAMSDAADSANTFSDSTNSLNEAFSKFNDETSSREDLVTAIGNVNQAYADEISKIDDVSAARQRGIELLQAESEEEAKQWQRDNASAINQAQKFLSGGTDISTRKYGGRGGGLSDSLVSSGATLKGLDKDTAHFDDVGKAVEALGQCIDELNEKREKLGELNDGESKQLEYLQSTYDNLNEQYQDATDIMKTQDAIVAYLAGDYDTLSEALDTVKGTSSDVADATSDVASAMDDAADSADNAAGAFDTANDKSGDLLKSLKNLGDAYEEFTDKGKLSYSTLQDIQDAFSDVDGINDYITALADSGTTAEDVSAILSDLTQKKIEATYTTEELANADVNMVSALLDEAGVADSATAALDMVTQAKFQLAIQSGASASEIYTMINGLYDEASASGTATDYLNGVVSAIQILSSSTLSTSQQCAALADLANYAYDAAYAVQLAMAYSTASSNADSHGYTGADKNAYVDIYVQNAKKKITRSRTTSTQSAQRISGGSSYTPKRYSYTPSASGSSSSGGGSKKSSGGGGSSGGSSASSANTADEQKEALEDRISLLQSELKLLQAQDAPNTEIIAKQRQIAQAYLDEAHYLQSIGGSQEEINNLMTEYYGVLSDIKDIESNLWDELKDAVETAKDEAIDRINAESDAESNLLEIEEKRKAVLEAQNDLLDAQNERTTRIYNAATGQWEWVADSSAIKQAQEALDKAKKELRVQEIEDAYSELEKEIEAAKGSSSGTRGVQTIIADLLSNFGTQDAVNVVNKVNKLLNALSGANTYDSGGILYGMGGIKATTRNEMVLDPNLTEKLLSPVADKTFQRRVAELGYLYGANAQGSNTLSGTAGSVSNITNNGGPYYINGVRIGENAANSMTIAQLARQMRSLSLYANS